MASSTGQSITGNMASGGNSPTFSHGSYYSHRMLVKFEKDGKNFVTDAMFPAEIQGTIDLYGVDEGFAALLRGMIMAYKPKVLLETGTHRGRSTRAIAEGMHENGFGMLYTVDMDNYGLMTSGAIRQHEKHFVTQIVGRTPEIFDKEPLVSLEGIDFAFIDGDHTPEGLAADMEYVDTHRADECLVLVDNARDPGWPGVEEYFREYSKYPHFCLPTLTGTQVVFMR